MKNILLILTICLLLASCGGGNGSSTPVDFTVINATLSPADATLVRSQIAKLNQIAQTRHSLDPLPLGSIRIEIMQHDARCEDPGSFIVEQDVYPGTNYDNDPNYDFDDRLGYVRVCAGGRYIDPSSGNERIQTTLEGIRRGNGVWFELEHMILFHRDHDRYLLTMYHTPETAHPILGE